MTVSKINPVNNYAGDSSVTRFDFDFLIEDERELLVQHTDSSGIQRTLTLDVDYSINEVGNKNGSYITFPLVGSEYSVLGTDEVISLSLELDIEQDKEYANSSKLNLITLEWSFDYIVRILQTMSRKIARSVKVQEGSTQTADELIEALQEAQINASTSAAAAAASAQSADTSATSAQTFADDAEESYNNTVAKYDEVVVTAEAEKTNITTLSTQQQNAITTLSDSALENISALGSQTEGSINTLSSNTLASLSSTAQQQIQNVQALGIFMEGDRLFYYTNGVKKEFRNDFGGIAPMAVKHKDIQKVSNGFALTWTDPDDSAYQENVYCTWGNTVIVRKVGSYPESPFDGDIVVNETVRNAYASTPYIDEVDNTIDYKYRAFPCSINKVYSVDNKNKFGVWVYAFTELDTESNPAKRITYLEDNEHFKPNYMDYTNDVFRCEDWKDSPFYSWEYIRPCMLNADGTVLEYLDPNDHSRTIDGAASHISDQNCGAQAMVEKRKIFKKTVINGEYRTVYFSNEKLDDDYECYPCLREDGTYNEFYYTPMFHGSLVGSKMMSLGGGRAAMSGKTAQQEIDAARLNGAGWDTEVWADIDMELEIFKLLFKNTDSQTVLGQGVLDSSNALSGSGVSGRTIAKGINYGTNSTNFPVKFRYRENFYSYQWQRFRGLMYINNIPYVKMTKHTGDGSTATDYNITGSGYIACNDIPAVTGTSGGYISATKSNKYGQFSTVVSGSSSTYLCDGRWFATGTMYPFRGGDSSGGALCGAFCLASTYAASVAGWSVGAALSYKPL